MLRIEIRHHTMASTIDRDINADVEGVERAVVYRADLNIVAVVALGLELREVFWVFPLAYETSKACVFPAPRRQRKSFHCASSTFFSARCCSAMRAAKQALSKDRTNQRIKHKGGKSCPGRVFHGEHSCKAVSGLRSPISCRAQRLSPAPPRWRSRPSRPRRQPERLTSME